MRNGISILFFLFFCGTELFSQEGKNAYLEEVISYENKLLSQQWNESGKPTFISYKVWSEDWEKNIVQSEVKMYRNKTNLHFFSNQVDIFTDEVETFMVLKTQKIILANTTPKSIMNKGMSDEFLAFRIQFLKSCKVESTTLIDSVKGIQQITLQLSDDMTGLLDIKSMIYKYDTINKKVVSTTVNYEKSYKLKKMVISYHDYKQTSDYIFQKPRKYIVTGNGSLLGKYKYYEFIDEREKAKL